MAAESEEVFSSHIRSLSASERVAFVADLLAAAGRDVAIEGRHLDVTEAGRTRTFVVGRPPAELDPDVIVLPSVGSGGVLATVRGRLVGTDFGKRFRKLAPSSNRGSDVTLIDAEELRMQLLYSVDRSTADALVREHFGTELQPPGEDREPSSSDSTSPLQSGAVVISLALLIGLIGGVALLSSTGGTPAADVNEWLFEDEPLADEESERLETIGPLSAGDVPRTDQTDDDQEFDGLDAVASDHRTAIESIDNDSVRVRYQGPSESPAAGVYLSGDGEGIVEYQLLLRDAGSYAIQERYTGGNQSANGATVDGNQSVNGTTVDGLRSTNTTVADRNQTVNTTVERYGHDGSERKENGTDPDPTGHDSPSGLRLPPAEFGTTLVMTYLDTEQVQRRDRGGGLEYRHEIEFTTTTDPSSQHELVATGPPESLAQEVEQYRAVAIIRADGLVERMQVRYTDPDTDSKVVIEIRLTRFDVSGSEAVGED